MNDRAERLLGTGPALVPVEPGGLGEDLVLVPGSSGLDLALVAGRDNLAQCLRVALHTALGGDVFNVAFGFDGLRALTGADPAEAEELLRLGLLRTLVADPRVARVLDVTVSRPPPGSGSRAWRVEAHLETVAGQQTRVRVEEVDPGD